MQNGGGVGYDRFGRKLPQYVDPAGGYQITEDYGWLNEREPPPEPVVPLGSNVPLTVLRNTPAGRAVRGLGALSRLLPPSVLKQISKGVNWLQKTPFNPLGLEEPPATTVERGIRALIRAPAPFATSDTPPSPAGVAALAPEARDMTRPTPYEEDPMLDSILQEARQPGTELQAKRSDTGLYSQLEDVVSKMSQSNFKTGEQAYNYLNKHVKDVEMQWSGLKDRLKGSNTKVTKQEILEHVRANDIKVIERRYDAPRVPELQIQTNKLKDTLRSLQEMSSNALTGDLFRVEDQLLKDKIVENERLMSDMERYPGRYRTPEHAGSTLSGGSNYRELLLQQKGGQRLSEAEEARWRKLRRTSSASRTVEEDIEYDALNRKDTAGRRVAYRDPHYKQINTIGWIRLKDVSGTELFTGVATPDIKDRTYIQMDPGITVLELTGDLQSDWAQKGWKLTKPEKGITGFFQPEILVEGKNKEHWQGLERRFRVVAEKTLQDRGLIPSNPDHMWYTKLSEALEENSGHQNAKANLDEIRRIEEERPLREASGAVLDFPFKREEHWTGLMLKHWLWEAANPPQGQEYDMLTWTPGEIQVGRMSPGRQFAETIVYRQPLGEDGEPSSRHSGELEVYDTRGNDIIRARVDKEGLSERLGKSVADRLLAQDSKTTALFRPLSSGSRRVYTLDAETDPGAVDIDNLDEDETAARKYLADTYNMDETAKRGIPYGRYEKNLRYYDETIANTFRQILKPLIGKKAANKAVGYVWRKVNQRIINELEEDPVAVRSGVVDVERGLIKMHSLNLTPELLEKVRAGLTKFAGGGPIYAGEALHMKDGGSVVDLGAQDPLIMADVEYTMPKWERIKEDPIALMAYEPRKITNIPGRNPGWDTIKRTGGIAGYYRPYTDTIAIHPSYTFPRRPPFGYNDSRSPAYFREEGHSSKELEEIAHADSLDVLMHELRHKGISNLVFSGYPGGASMRDLPGNEEQLIRWRKARPMLGRLRGLVSAKNAKLSHETRVSLQDLKDMLHYSHREPRHTPLSYRHRLGTTANEFDALTELKKDRYQPRRSDWENNEADFDTWYQTQEGMKEIDQHEQDYAKAQSIALEHIAHRWPGWNYEVPESSPYRSVTSTGVGITEPRLSDVLKEHFDDDQEYEKRLLRELRSRPRYYMDKDNVLEEIARRAEAWAAGLTPPAHKAEGGIASKAPEARDMFGKPRSMGKEPRPTALSPGTNPGVAGLCGVARNMNRSVVA
jgi:hypothetical protein